MGKNPKGKQRARIADPPETVPEEPEDPTDDTVRELADFDDGPPPLVEAAQGGSWNTPVGGGSWGEPSKNVGGWGQGAEAGGGWEPTTPDEDEDHGGGWSSGVTPGWDDTPSAPRQGWGAPTAAPARAPIPVRAPKSNVSAAEGWNTTAPSGPAPPQTNWSNWSQEHQANRRKTWDAAPAAPARAAPAVVPEWQKWGNPPSRAPSHQPQYPQQQSYQTHRKAASSVNDARRYQEDMLDQQARMLSELLNNPHAQPSDWAQYGQYEQYQQVQQYQQEDPWASGAGTKSKKNKNRDPWEQQSQQQTQQSKKSKKKKKSQPQQQQGGNGRDDFQDNADWQDWGVDENAWDNENWGDWQQVEEEEPQTDEDAFRQRLQYALADGRRLSNSMPSKTWAIASNGGASVAFDSSGRRPDGQLWNARFVENPESMKPAQAALFGRNRFARDRIHWLFSPYKDQRVASLLEWIEAMSREIGAFGLQKFLRTRERGALFANADYRPADRPNEPALVWLGFDDVQWTLDKVLQESVALYDPAVQVYVFVFLLSRSGNSMAIWRRKVPVPNNDRLSWGREITQAKAALRRLTDYKVYVDELPSTEHEILVPPAKGKNKLTKKKWWKKWF